jgi:hypothetical protein
VGILSLLPIPVGFTLELINLQSIDLEGFLLIKSLRRLHRDQNPAFTCSCLVVAADLRLVPVTAIPDAPRFSEKQ